MFQKISYDAHSVVPTTQCLEMQVANHLVQQVRLILTEHNLICTRRKLLDDSLRIS
ncbi:hypothetical protein D9M68_722900 [compost metagenome]